MLVSEAKRVAAAWATGAAHTHPSIEAAFLHGSICYLADDQEIAATSDVDLIVVHHDAPPALKTGKQLHDDVVLDVSLLSLSELVAADHVLARYDIAGSLAATTLLFDRTGRLTALHEAVRRDFPKREWVLRRCQDALARMERYLAPPDPGAPLHAMAMSSIFAAGVATHVVLVAGLRNPTVRTRYVAVRGLLAEHARLDAHEALLRLGGYQHISAESASAHLASLEAAFDDASRVRTTPVFFGSDISADTRHVAIDGSRDLIAHGLHREAMFWIAATACRCQFVLAADGTDDDRARHLPAFLALLSDLGLANEAGILARNAGIAASRDWLWDLALALLDDSKAVSNLQDEHHPARATPEKRSGHREPSG